MITQSKDVSVVWCWLTLWRDPIFVWAAWQTAVVGIESGHVTRSITPGGWAFDLSLLWSRALCGQQNTCQSNLIWRHYHFCQDRKVQKTCILQHTLRTNTLSSFMLSGSCKVAFGPMRGHIYGDNYDHYACRQVDVSIQDYYLRWGCVGVYWTIYWKNGAH